MKERQQSNKRRKNKTHCVCTELMEGDVKGVQSRTVEQRQVVVNKTYREWKDVKQHISIDVLENVASGNNNNNNKPSDMKKSGTVNENNKIEVK